MKANCLYLMIVVCTLGVLGQRAFAARKGGGRRKLSRFEKMELTTLSTRETSCLDSDKVIKELQDRIFTITQTFNLDLEERLYELSDSIDDILREQNTCHKEKEELLRNNLKCEFPTKTTTPSTTTIAPTTTTATEKTSKIEGTVSIPMCNSDNCKALVSKMLDMIDHSAEPCEDFYQYACGGVENDPHLSPEDPMVDANMRLKRTIRTLDHNNFIMGSARIFYDACLDWEKNPDSPDSLQYARGLTKSLGWFLPTKPSIGIDPSLESPIPPTNLTHMIGEFMLSHFTPFFDVSVEEDSGESNRFLAKISIPFVREELSKDVAHLTCLREFDEKVWNRSIGGGAPLNLNEEYEHFKICKNTEGLRQKLLRMEKAVTTMNLLDHVKEESRQELLVAMKQDTEIFLRSINEKLQDQIKLKSDVLSKKSQINTFEDLDHLFGREIYWKELLQKLFGPTVWNPKQNVVIYHQKEIQEILTIITDMWNKNKITVHNSLLMLWSEWVYSSLISPLKPPENYCIEGVKFLLPDISSALYLHSFSDVHLARAQKKMKTKVQLIQKTFADMFHEKDDVQKKINLADVNVGAFFDAASRNQSLLDSTQGMNLNSSHAYNMDFLFKRLQRLKYKTLNERTNSPRAMWIKGIVPFQNQGFYVHETNHMYLPFGTFFPPYFYFRKYLPEYVLYGGIGHLVAEQFVHMVDRTGKDYTGESKTTLNIPGSLIASSECIGEWLNSEFAVEDKNVQAIYKMPLNHFKLNDLLSFSGATVLSWKAYLASQHDSTGPPPPEMKSKEDSLIWLGETPLQPLRAYYLRVAQTHCSASSKIDLLNIMENKQMLPRHKINFIFGTDQLFSETFECSSHSRMNRITKCPFLPPQNLHY